MYCPGCCKVKTACWCRLTNLVSYVLIVLGFTGLIIGHALRSAT